MPWPRAIIFDFDGVIVNSEPLHFLAFQETLAREDIELTEQEYFRDLIGYDDKGAIRHLYQTRNRPLAPKTFLRIMAEKSQAMMNLILNRRLQALPGVEEFVRGLWRNYPLGICSGALREEIEVMLEGVCLRDCFQAIVAAEDVHKGKPDPEGYFRTMALLAEKAKTTLKPSDCLVVEDAPKVCRAVRLAGFSALGVATSYPVEKLTDANWAVQSLHPDNVLVKIPALKILR